MRWLRAAMSVLVLFLWATGSQEASQGEGQGRVQPSQVGGRALAAFQPPLYWLEHVRVSVPWDWPGRTIPITSLTLVPSPHGEGSSSCSSDTASSAGGLTPPSLLGRWHMPHVIFPMPWPQQSTGSTYTSPSTLHPATTFPQPHGTTSDTGVSGWDKHGRKLFQMYPSFPAHWALPALAAAGHRSG